MREVSKTGPPVKLERDGEYGREGLNYLPIVPKASIYSKVMRKPVDGW